MSTQRVAMSSRLRKALSCAVATLFLCLALVPELLLKVQALELNTPPQIALPSEILSTLEGETVEIGTGSLFRRSCAQCIVGVLVPHDKY